MLRIKFSDKLFSVFFLYLVFFAYSFHDSTYIKRQTLSGGGHKFSDFFHFHLKKGHKS